MVACADATTSGLLDRAAEPDQRRQCPPAIVSVSYGECEVKNGAAANAAYAAYQTGVAEGWSIFVSAGDQGAGGCNFGGETVTDGVGVNGLGSTVYNVAVGGTDFGDTFAHQNDTYWNSTNSATFGSALSYIPEIPWNTTCGSQLFATFEGFATTYGASGFCNSSFVANTAGGFYLRELGGLRRPEPVRPGSPSISGVITGSCTGWPKPSWQSGLLGNPADSLRDLPDVSMFASLRSVASRLCNLLFRYRQRRHGVQRHHRRLEHRLGRHVIRLADLGRHSGAGQPVHRIDPGQSQSGALSARRRRIWCQRQ